MRISDWSSDVCSSDLSAVEPVCSDFRAARARRACRIFLQDEIEQTAVLDRRRPHHSARAAKMHDLPLRIWRTDDVRGELLRCTRPRWVAAGSQLRSEEHTSELQSLMRNSYAVFCLKKKKKVKNNKMLK